MLGKEFVPVSNGRSRGTSKRRNMRDKSLFSLLISLSEVEQMTSGGDDPIGSVRVVECFPFCVSRWITEQIGYRALERCRYVCMGGESLVRVMGFIAQQNVARKNLFVE